MYDELLARVVETRRYEMADHNVKALQRLDMSVFTDNIGPGVMPARSDLVAVLRKDCGDLEVRLNTTVESIDQDGRVVRVVFSDRVKLELDLLFGCEGIHSRVRNQILGKQEMFHTGWTIWTWWGREGLLPLDLVREYWGRGFFFGAYPVCDGAYSLLGCRMTPSRAREHRPRQSGRSLPQLSEG